MTLQQLKYMITAAEAGSITGAAKELFIPQPSLSDAAKEVEREAGISIFTRYRAGIALTKEGMESLGYAHQVVQQMELLESKYIPNQPAKQQFCIPAQYYAFTVNAFVRLVQHFGQKRLEFILSETQTHQIIMDVKSRFSDMGILYFSNDNKNVLQKSLEENDSVFYELFAASSHVFLYKGYPLTNQNSLKLKDLQPCPRLSFVQGNYESDCLAEELLSNEPAEKGIKVDDRTAIISFMIGLGEYIISGGIFPKYLQGNDIISILLDEDGMVRIGYTLNKDAELTELGEIYIDALKKYRPQ